jgi:hypothetical protein
MTYILGILLSWIFASAPNLQNAVTSELNQGNTELIDDHALVAMDSVWPESDRTIHVCWENPETASKDQRDTVQSAVMNSWERYSGLRFIWADGQCVSQTYGLRIFVEDSVDEGPHTNCLDGDRYKCLGRFLDGLNHGIVLNFSYKKWSPSCQTRIPYCDKAIAVHEFGHAIGFAHEQNSPKAPGECQKLSQGQGGTALTPYDRHSVMNYCNNSEFKSAGELSYWDRDALNRIYPKEN